MVDQESIKWGGEITQEIYNITPQQLWPLFEDFGSFNKLFTHVDKCYIVEGVQGEVGVIRYCESLDSSSGAIQYVKEKLLMVDPSNMCLSYEVLDNNIGFKSYVAIVRLFPVDGDGDGGGEGGRCGCNFVWTFVADPIEGFTQESLCEFLKSLALAMAKNVEDTFCRP